MGTKRTASDQATLFDLPDHYVKDRAVWRRKVQRDRDLSHGARLYAGWLAFHRWTKGTVAWTRDRAAGALGVSIRTIQRWNAELVDAGWLERLVSAMPGRCQIFKMTNPQVRMGDTRVSPKVTEILATRPDTADPYLNLASNAWRAGNPPLRPPAGVPGRNAPACGTVA